ncbi:MAG: VWA domain-containing protein [Gammaproteobacteria bacterium]|nr:VWA domain-containing protein [Gammaproteobacteria bacterium]
MSSLARSLCGNRFPRQWLAGLLGAVLSLGLAPTLHADDAEIFLSDRSTATARANILFIIDTSGSMNALVDTQVPYDPDTNFSGCYRRDALYYTTTSGLPPCDSPDLVLKTINYCEASKQPLAEVGYYADSLLGWNYSNQRWHPLSGDREDDPAECLGDRGIHGAAFDSEPFASNGPQGPWAIDDGQEPAWTDRYTVYDGNWLNWTTNAPTAQRTRLDIVKTAVNDLVASIGNVNVGVMRFNRSEGGRVIAAMEDIETSRNNVQNIVNGLTASGQTPLSETLYEATQYFMGRLVDYGNSVDERSVAASRVGNDPDGSQYQTPLDEACSRNFIILLTDGEPSADDGAVARIRGLPDFATTVAPDCDGSGQGRCLDDLAEYLASRDLSPTLAGIQTVTTHTIGFAADFPLLESTAERGGGKYLTADDTASLATALSGIALSLFDNTGSFAAPTVPVNAFNRSENLGDVYLSVFQPSDRTRWIGNLKKYRFSDGELVGQDGENVIDPLTGLFRREAFSFWSAQPDGDRAGEGGAASRLPESSQRRLFSNVAGDNLSDAANRIRTDNANISAALASVPADEQRNLIEWTLGRDVRDQDQDGNLAETRRDMGDALHVQPVTLLYSGTEADPVSTVFLPTNDGFLHALDSQTGEELWAFLPARLLAGLYPLYLNEETTSKHYRLDGELNLVVLNDDGRPGLSGAERAILLFGMGRGGDGIFAVDVTARDAPRLLWEISSSNPDFADLGQTWSTPAAARVRIDNQVRNVLVFGGGYDAGQDNRNYRIDTQGNAIYMVDLLTGESIWSAGHPDAIHDHQLLLDEMQHSIPAPVRPLDINGDGLADRMYVGDMGGRLWRFDIVNGRPRDDLVEGGVLASLGAPASGPDAAEADLRRFYAAPDVVPTVINRKLVILLNIGSGYRGHPLDTAISEQFFSVRDFNAYGVIDTAAYPDTPVSIEQLTDITDDVSPTLPFSTPGWRLRLNQGAGEKVLGESLTLENTVFFTSFTPGETANECSAGTGINRLYAISSLDGSPRVDLDRPDETEPLTILDRFRELRSGIPVITINRVLGEDGKTMICVGPQCLDGEELGIGRRPPVRRTYWFQDESQ